MTIIRPRQKRVNILLGFVYEIVRTCIIRETSDQLSTKVVLVPVVSAASSPTIMDAYINVYLQ